MANMAAAKNPNVEDVLEHIYRGDGEPSTARQIAARLHCSRRIVNQILYQLEKEGRVRKTQYADEPPLWSTGVTLPESDEDTKAVPRSVTFVLVDLGNVHDCLPKLAAMLTDAEVATTLKVHAFADAAFNGYGVNPPVDPELITVHQTTSRSTNAADIDLIWFVAETVLQARHPASPLFGCELEFIVATKDHGFASLADHVKANGHTMHFVPNWTELLKLVE
jgi:hypothetical protein